MMKKLLLLTVLLISTTSLRGMYFTWGTTIASNPAKSTTTTREIDGRLVCEQCKQANEILYKVTHTITSQYGPKIAVHYYCNKHKETPLAFNPYHKNINTTTERIVNTISTPAPINHDDKPNAHAGMQLLKKPHTLFLTTCAAICGIALIVRIYKNRTKKKNPADDDERKSRV